MEVERVDFVSVSTPFCKDPDGNVLILHRRYAPTTGG
jgi:hypothetical protein